MSATMDGAPLGATNSVAAPVLRVRQAVHRYALPGALPAGERVLWQGAPEWRGLARNALHLRGLGLYLGILVAWVGVHGAWQGQPAATVALDTGKAALAAVVPLAVGLLYAWLSARAAAYTITNKRAVIRLGLVVPLTLNLPFARIDSAGLNQHADGTGDIALKLAPGSKGLGWFILWPHTRPWHMAAAQPMLRDMPDAARAAETLARALTEAVEASESLAQPSIIVDTPECHHGETTVTA